MFFKRFIKYVLIFLILFISVSCDKKEMEKPVRLGYLQNDLHHLPLFVAIEKKLFIQAGLDVEISGIFKAGPEQMSAFDLFHIRQVFLDRNAILLSLYQKVMPDSEQ